MPPRRRGLTMRKSVLKYILCLILCVAGCTIAQAQVPTDTISGEVSYKTSQNIYVRFKSTKDILPGDTLFFITEGQLQPMMVVKNISSTSCVGVPVTTAPVELGQRIVARRKIKPEPELTKEEVIAELPPALKESPDKDDLPEEAETSTTGKPAVKPGENLKGRVSAASYMNFSDRPEYTKQRMRYTFTMNAKNLGLKNLSLESYISFRHTLGEWQEVKDNFKRAFKLYTLALHYEMPNGFRIWAGRKINFNLSNIGAIDGLQAEKKWKRIVAGVFAGSRPDHTDYGINLDLLQYGAYTGHTLEGKNGTMQNTVAFAEQRNGGMTDRRFGYVQHMNSLIKRVFIFSSAEFDLYTLENNLPKSTFSLSSIYFSLRYKVSDRLSVSGSYDARKNIIYYETYKNFLDQLLEDETRQGLRMSVNYRPLKYISLGSSAGYRFQKDSPEDSKNLHSYLTVSRVPGIQASATLSVMLLQSPYLKGTIYGARLSRDIIKGKLFGEAEYRIVDNHYINVETPSIQSIAGLNLNWRLTQKLSLSVHYEGETYQQKLSHRVNSNLIQRF